MSLEPGLRRANVISFVMISSVLWLVALGIGSRSRSPPASARQADEANEQFHGGVIAVAGNGAVACSGAVSPAMLGYEPRRDIVAQEETCCPRVLVVWAAPNIVDGGALRSRRRGYAAVVASD